MKIHFILPCYNPNHAQYPHKWWKFSTYRSKLKYEASELKVNNFEFTNIENFGPK